MVCFPTYAPHQQEYFLKMALVFHKRLKTFGVSTRFLLPLHEDDEDKPH